MKKIIGLVFLTLISSMCFGRRIMEPRQYIFSLLSDTSLVWERDDNYFSYLDLWITYPKKLKVLRHWIRACDGDTVVTYRGTSHTWKPTLDCWTFNVDFNTFYNGYDYRN